MCPLHCANQEFESAEELQHQVTGNLSTIIATYAMRVEADDIFRPWSLVVQRLETAGLIAVTDDNDEDEDHDGHCRKKPLLVAITWAGDESLPRAVWQKFDRNYEEPSGPLSWALMEGATRNHSPIVLGVCPKLLGPPLGMTEASMANHTTKRSDVILPPLSTETRCIKLPSSLLEKSIRRSFCSTQPLLEACATLLYGVPLSGIPYSHELDEDDKNMNTYYTRAAITADAVKAPSQNSAAATTVPSQGIASTVKVSPQSTTSVTMVQPPSITAVDTAYAIGPLSSTVSGAQDGAPFATTTDPNSKICLSSTATTSCVSTNNSPSSFDVKTCKKTLTRPLKHTTNPPLGGTLAILSTTLRCMLDDASPFAAPPDGSMLGLEELFMLSLIAKADPTWRLPSKLFQRQWPRHSV